MEKKKPDPKVIEKAKKDRIKALSLSFSDARAAVRTIATICNKGTLPGDDLATRKSSELIEYIDAFQTTILNEFK